MSRMVLLLRARPENTSAAFTAYIANRTFDYDFEPSPSRTTTHRSCLVPAIFENGFIEIPDGGGVKSCAFFICVMFSLLARERLVFIARA